MKTLVYSNEEYAIVTVSANNLELWKKIRISKTKKSPKLVKRWVYTQLYGNLL